MITLAAEYTKNGFQFIQAKREGLVAIYEQRTLEDNTLICYEVFEIIEYPDQHVGPKRVFCPARETPPNSESWGSKGFTTHTLEQAQARLEELRAKLLARSEKKEGSLPNEVKVSKGVQKSNKVNKTKSEAKRS